MAEKILAIDVGNSEIKYATVEGGVVAELFRHSSSDMDGVLERLGELDYPIVFCSVRQNATEKIKKTLDKAGKNLVLQVDSRINNPVSGFYNGIGADRVAEISAAWTDTDGSRPVAVVGLGTATTITTASSAGIFKGGFITLGLGAICAKLTEALPELPPVDPNQAKTLTPGFDTYSSICRGTVAAHVGMIEKWVGTFRAELGDDLAVVATGGWSPFLAPWCPFFDKVDPVLSLRGLWCIYKESAQKFAS